MQCAPGRGVVARTFTNSSRIARHVHSPRQGHHIIRRRDSCRTDQPRRPLRPQYKPRRHITESPHLHLKLLISIYPCFPARLPLHTTNTAASAIHAMSSRGRSPTPKRLTPTPGRPGKDVSMSPHPASPHPASASPNRAASPARPLAVVVVEGLSKNVGRAHLQEIFGEYGRVTGLDLPLFKVCEYALPRLELEVRRIADASRPQSRQGGD